MRELDEVAGLPDWASFTLSAAALCREHGRPRVDAEIARNTLALHGGALQGGAVTA